MKILEILSVKGNLSVWPTFSVGGIGSFTCVGLSKWEPKHTFLHTQAHIDARSDIRDDGATHIHTTHITQIQ